MTKYLKITNLWKEGFILGYTRKEPFHHGKENQWAQHGCSIQSRADHIPFIPRTQQ